LERIYCAVGLKQICSEPGKHNLQGKELSWRVIDQENFCGLAYADCHLFSCPSHGPRPYLAANHLDSCPQCSRSHPSFADPFAGCHRDVGTCRSGPTFRSGTLRDAVAYPVEGKLLADDRARAVIKDEGLGYLLAAEMGSDAV